MSLLHVLVLAIIQGLTEFLPVSSSAHLIFPSHLLGWEDQGLAFDVAVHFGTLLAVILYYMADLVKIGSYTIEAAFKFKVTPIARIGLCIIVATIPVCIGGVFLESVVKSIRENIHVIAWTTIGFGLLLGLASYANRKMIWKNISPNQGARADSLRQLTYVQALFIGMAQVIAVIPGTSRSGITLTAGLFLGMRPEAAARFSFLLSIPVILASALFELLKIYNTPNMTVDWMSIILGSFLSFIVALIVIHLFLKYIAKSGMALFVIYRVLLGAVLLWMF